jgi:hypothetical protein
MDAGLHLASDVVTIESGDVVNKRSIIAVLLGAAAFACGTEELLSPPPAEEPEQEIIVERPRPPPTEARITRAGATFGFCVGYCRGELAIDGAALELTTHAIHGATGPDLVTEGTLTESAIAELRAIEAELASAPLDAVYGCPNCVDGGEAFLVLTGPDGTESESRFDFARVAAGCAETVATQRRRRSTRRRRRSTRRRRTRARAAATRPW